MAAIAQEFTSKSVNVVKRIDEEAGPEKEGIKVCETLLTNLTSPKISDKRQSTGNKYMTLYLGDVVENNAIIS